jgi:hypothetical protein
MDKNKCPNFNNGNKSWKKMFSVTIKILKVWAPKIKLSNCDCKFQKLLIFYLEKDFKFFCVSNIWKSWKPKNA